jgi:hypothetical protein
LNNNACDQNSYHDSGALPPSSQSAVGLEQQSASSNCDLSTLSWSVAAILLLFLCLTYLGVLLCFGFGFSVSPFVAPIALLLALAIGVQLARREGLRGLPLIWPPAIALGVMAISLLLAAAFFDMSWDGLWYHQTAIYQMAHGWNPLSDPMHGFTPHLQDWLRHYAKGPWYVDLALFQTTGNIEWAKAAPWMAMTAMFFAVFAASIDFGMKSLTAAVIATLVSLNPVVVCQLASFLVDCLLVSFLACFVAAMFRWFKRPNLLVNVVVIVSAILCINAKFTGLVYLCFACAAFGIYVLIKRRDLLFKYAAIQIVSLMLGIFLFGYNSYVTNTVHRGHPFYPLMGTTAWPSHAQQGRDPVELYETPKNMVGRNRYIRFFYALFSHPGPQVFMNGEDAILMWPFNIRWEDVTVFRFHEVRLSGFGPLFSGAFIIGILLLPVVLIQPGIQRVIVILFVGTIIISLSISTHSWWARFGPQLWWLPIVSVIAGLAVPGWRAVRWAAWGLATLLLINAALVAYGHFRWEIEATRTTYEQLALLRQKTNVEVNMQFFGEPFGERLRTAGITFHATERLRGPNQMELMSVVPGYPGAVRASYQDKRPGSDRRIKAD